MMSNQIHYKTINVHLNEQQTIVFLHEGIGCIDTWKNYPQLLCDRVGMRGIVFDRAGYGNSKGNFENRTTNYLIDAADELNDFLKYLQLDKVLLYGHSDGGSIALAFAAKFPTKVMAIVSEAAHVLNERKTISGIKLAIKAFEQGKLKGLSKWHGNNYVKVFRAWSNTWLKPEFNLETLKNLLPQITVNQLIIQGTNDQYATRSQIDTIQRNTIGTSYIFEPICGHSPYMEAQSEVLRAASQYIINQANGAAQN